MSTSTVDFDVDVDLLANPQSILLGFLDPVTTGFDLLRFRANVEGGAAEIDLTWTRVQMLDAIAYFNDHVVVLGDWTGAGTGNILDMQFIFDVTSDDAGANFNTDFLVGNGTITPLVIPEPSTYVLFAFGLVGLGLITRRRRIALRIA